DIRVDLKQVDKAVKGEHFSIKTPEKIRPNDQLYKMVKAERRGTAHER
ncbi:MAG: U32 family peptidase, partial [Petrimonas sp.]